MTILLGDCLANNRSFALRFTVTEKKYSYIILTSNTNEKDNAMNCIWMHHSRAVLSSWYNLDYCLSLQSKESAAV